MTFASLRGSFLPRASWKLFLACGILAIVAVPVLFSQPQFNPDSLLLGPESREDYNPYETLYSMNSWTTPVLDHTGKPHTDGHAIQLVMDGGNGIQDPPNSDGSPGGDDSLGAGNFQVQFINGAKHLAEGMEAGMFVGVRYFIPYKPNSSIYLRLWEGSDPRTARYYQDTVEYTTFQGNSGGPIVDLRPESMDDIDWRFGPSKEVNRKR
jgi:hypothetical protein